MARNERQALLYNDSIKEVHGRDPSDINLRDHLAFRNNHLVSNQHYILYANGEDMVKRGCVDLALSTGVLPLCRC